MDLAVECLLTLAFIPKITNFPGEQGRNIKEVEFCLDFSILSSVLMIKSLQIQSFECNFFFVEFVFYSSVKQHKKKGILKMYCKCIDCYFFRSEQGIRLTSLVALFCLFCLFGFIFGGSRLELSCKNLL